MKTRTQGPNKDRPKITLLCAEPVDELAGEEVAESINERERSGNRTVVVIGPLKLRCNEVLPRKGEDLAVEIVHGRGGEKHRTHDPTE